VAPPNILPPGAKDWEEPSFNIPDYRVLGPNEVVEPGDVIAGGGHVAIVSVRVRVRNGI
jgi:hypothetical protein